MIVPDTEFRIALRGFINAILSCPDPATFNWLFLVRRFSCSHKQLPESSPSDYVEAFMTGTVPFLVRGFSQGPMIPSTHTGRLPS